MPSLFNAAHYLLDRQLEAGRGNAVALTGPAGQVTYTELWDRVGATAAGLRQIGVQPEHRLVMFMADSPDFVTVFLAALRIGAIPVPISTMLRSDGLSEILRDSRARFLAVSPEFTSVAAEGAREAPDLSALLMAGGEADVSLPQHDLGALGQTAPDGDVFAATEDSPGFWLYTSGTTGTPKGAMHRHESIRVVCETYATRVLGITRADRCLSAAKAFFAYGLGNSVLFPLSVGASSVLEPSPSRPDVIAERAARFTPSLFFAGPSFFAAMLRAVVPKDALAGVRLAVSAGEALPAGVYHRWTEHFGVDILDGIGMTETLHVFLSNRAGAVRPGTTGVAVPGYELRIVDESGADVDPGAPGTLLVRGSSAATGYWCRYDASRQVFQGEWVRTGDTYVRDADGYYACLGRSGDMLKAGGIWVAPAEVEGRLMQHEAVAQAVVVGAPDADGLETAVAFVLTEPEHNVTEAELITFCRERLAAFKRPRRVVFVESYPTTSTGKIRRVELRETAAAVLRDAAPTP